MKTDRHGVPGSYTAIAAILFFAMSPLAGARVHASPEARDGPLFANGTFQVHLETQGAWQPLTEMPFGKYFTERHVDLSPYGLTGPVRLKVVHSGGTEAHIDAVLIDGKGAVAVEGTPEKTGLALRKLGASDYDVVHAAGRSVTLTFDCGEGAKTLTMTARIEPARLSTTPSLNSSGGNRASSTPNGPSSSTRPTSSRFHSTRFAPHRPMTRPSSWPSPSTVRWRRRRCSCRVSRACQT